MGQISSINFKKSISIQMPHNDRSIPPSYIIGGDFSVNRNTKEALALKEKIIKEAKEAYRKHVGQTFQSKSFEWSAVVNIKDSTSMQDLESLAEHFNKKYGFQCYQIAIHRDEGHIDEQGQKVINHHAHLEFITLDKHTGRSLSRDIYNNKAKMREIQTEVAQILQMERGIDKRISKTKRIEPRAYAKIKEQEKENKKKLNLEIKDLKSKKQELESKNKDLSAKIENLNKEIITQKDVKTEFEKVRKLMISWGFCDKDDYKIRAEALNKALQEAKDNKGKYTQEQLNKHIESIKATILAKHKQEIDSLKNDIQILKINQKSEINKAITENVKHIYKSVQKDYNDFYDAKDNTENLINSLKEDSKKLKSYKQQITTLESNINTLNAQISYLNNETQKNNTNIALEKENQFKSHLNAQEQQIQNLIKQNNNLLQENENLKAENSVLKQFANLMLDKVIHVSTFLYPSIDNFQFIPKWIKSKMQEKIISSANDRYLKNKNVLGDNEISISKEIFSTRKDLANQYSKLLEYLTSTTKESSVNTKDLSKGKNQGLVR